MSGAALKPGARVWRIGRAGCVSCIFLRHQPGAQVYIRSSTFARDFHIVPAAGVYADRDACRAEIQRRKATEESHG
jgi:hypothetical protein